MVRGELLALVRPAALRGQVFERRPPRPVLHCRLLVQLRPGHWQPQPELRRQRPHLVTALQLLLVFLEGLLRSADPGPSHDIPGTAPSCEASGEQVIYAPADSSAGGLVK